MKPLFILSVLLLITFAFIAQPTIAVNEDPTAIQIQKQDQDQLQDPAGPAERYKKTNTLGQSDIQATITQKRTDAQEKKASLQEQHQEKLQNRCENITNRVNNRINQYEQNQAKHQEKYQHLKSKIEDLSSKLETRGCDTSTIDTDLVELDSKIQAFAAQYRDFIDELKDSRTYACGESNNEFSSQVRAAHGQLQDVKTEAKAIHNYFSGTLKPHLRQVHQSCQSASPTS